ncbi:hypothetical protein [Roseomonas sp. CECT 9278]|uniref:hypothetical protein n=1 Tax=Roseomonas sp. CECT 9278 TaxID=2845823 RepID=UPI001E51F251|nr:hypothetical protein [Roseomonas sp. CECT 9278]CAH0151990.1 hypothetical protein ROS9278_00739 [Roseomonas sp. CECT 9278]
MRNLLAVTLVAASVLGFQGGTQARSLTETPAATLVAGPTTPARAQAERLLLAGAFAIALDRAWDFMTVAHYNRLDATIGAIERGGMPDIGISTAEAATIIRRGFLAGQSFARSHAKDSAKGRDMMQAVKDVFEK